MTQDEIVKLAREAELHCHVKLTEHGLIIEDLQYFANLVATAEREACAKAVEVFDRTFQTGGVIAHAIRARGEK